MTHKVRWARNLLGVSNVATKQEVKLAWKQKMKRFHPDKPHGNADMAKKCNAAKYILEKSIDDEPISYYIHDKVKFYPFHSLEDELFFWDAVLTNTLDDYFSKQ